MAARNPASVFPDPVGAQMSVCRPARIAGQPPLWASVGPWGNRRSNHTRTAGWNRATVPAWATVGVDGSELTPSVHHTLAVSTGERAMQAARASVPSSGGPRSTRFVREPTTE
jgi:hypothetical protein